MLPFVRKPQGWRETGQDVAVSTPALELKDPWRRPDPSARAQVGKLRTARQARARGHFGSEPPSPASPRLTLLRRPPTVELPEESQFCPRVCCGRELRGEEGSSPWELPVRICCD